MTIEIKVTDGAGNSSTKTVNLVVEQPTTNFRASRPMIFGAATTNNQQDFNALNTAWGPIRMSREYDSGGGFKAVNNYSWYNFVTNNFKYLLFSADESNTDYPNIAAGQFDSKIQTMVNSVKNLLVPAGIKGVISLGNEPNASKGIDPSNYRAAIEHVIDTFGDEPAPGWVWGVSFSNYNVWGGGRTDGELWLPRRDNKKFAVSTHCYGSDHWTSHNSQIGQSFVPAMNKVGRRDNWVWGIGETSAKEHSTNPDKKGTWMRDYADYVASQGGSWYLPFDTNVGGSADVGSSPTTTAYVKAIAEKYKNNNWTA